MEKRETTWRETRNARENTSDPTFNIRITWNQLMKER